MLIVAGDPTDIYDYSKDTYSSILFVLSSRCLASQAIMSYFVSYARKRSKKVITLFCSMSAIIV